jgi:uncharacterized protein (DUF1501 family)
MKINRRNFLKVSAAASSLFFTGFGIPANANVGKKKNLIIIMLRGGMDGLTAIPIKGDKNYEKLRSEIKLDKTLSLNSDFELHPVLKNFKDLWDQNLSAAVHATNIPYTGRSHFDGQNLMESGGKIPYEIQTGWLGRGMKLANLKGDGLALSLPMPLLIRGIDKNDNYFPVRGDTLPEKEILEIIRDNYSENSEKELYELLNTVLNRKTISTGSRHTYSLALTAGQQLSRKDGPRVAVFEVDGFDTHAAQGGEHGAHADCLFETDSILKALKTSLGDTFNDTLILTLTEFGRTIKQNASNGTEHGYASAVLMAGGLLKKSQIYTDWPGLKKKELFEGRDLNSTIDARSVYASAMSTVFDLDFKRIEKDVFFGDKLQNLSDKLFKA